MIEDAKKIIEVEKESAIKEVKILVASLSLEIAEKILKKNLKNDSSQKEVIDDLLTNLKIDKN